VFLAARCDDVVELCRALVSAASGGVEAQRTIPELLLILEVVRYLKRHIGVGNQPPHASFPVVGARTLQVEAGWCVRLVVRNWNCRVILGRVRHRWLFSQLHIIMLFTA
jgi:hypothetical protein